MKLTREEAKRRVGLAFGGLDDAEAAAFDYLTFYVLGSRVFSANVDCKICIPLLLVVVKNFVQRFAGGRSRKNEHPRAFRASPAPKTLFFDPYQFTAHGPSTLAIWCGYALVRDGVA